MFSKEYKEDFLKVTNPSEFVKFQEKYKNEKVKLIDLDDEMKRHFNRLIKTKPENPNIHTDVYKNTMKTT